MLTVHLKPGCPYCLNTMEKLNFLNINKKLIKELVYNTITKRYHKKKLNKNTFPQVILSIGGNFILWLF